ncbi:MAG: hypothetical protein PVF91_09420 [Chromatiales bacterium]|jgi:ATP adenylyltransferase
MTAQILPGTLARAVDDTTARALASGALQPIETDERFVEEGGVRFLVRSVSSLARKALERLHDAGAAAASPRAANPFLPPEPELTVGAVSDTHVAILNKFNVLDRHLLIVTRRFEHQERLLGPEDFDALWRCMAEYDALGFYNGGEVAGASQPHKHLQMVPLPLLPDLAEVPVTPLLDRVPDAEGMHRVPGLPFLHTFARLAPGLHRNPSRAATLTGALYRAMLARAGLRTVQAADGPRQSGPYNLLVTRRWMLLVPRSVEYWEGISVNSLGFAGSLFVREAAQMDLIRRLGPFAVLRGVAHPVA